MDSKLLVDATSPSRIPETAIRAAVSKAPLKALSLAVPWKSIEPTPGDFSGLATARACRELAHELGLKFDLRVRAGKTPEQTPAHSSGPTYVPKGTPFGNPPQPDPAAGKTIPRPFYENGNINAVLRDGLRRLASGLGAFCNEDIEGTGMIHGTWPGGNSAEMYYTPETEGLQGHSWEAVKLLHINVLAAFQNRIPASVELEMPFGGLVGPPFIKLQAEVYKAMAAKPGRPQYIQLNWLDDRPTPPNGDTLTNFDTRLAIPPRHGLQMIHANEYDWVKVFARAKASGADYTEFYLKQFSYPSTPQLCTQIEQALTW